MGHALAKRIRFSQSQGHTSYLVPIHLQPHRLHSSQPPLYHHRYTTVAHAIQSHRGRIFEMHLWCSLQCTEGFRFSPAGAKKDASPFHNARCNTPQVVHLLWSHLSQCTWSHPSPKGTGRDERCKARLTLAPSFLHRVHLSNL